MALINCPECGKQISDKAANCPNCGCPIMPVAPASGLNQKPASVPQGAPVVQPNPIPAPQPQPEPKRKESVLGIIGLILSVFFCLPILAAIGFVLCIIAIFDKKHSSVCATIGIIFCIFSIIISVLAPQYQKKVDEINAENQVESSATTTDIPLSQRDTSIIDSQENAEAASVDENVAREDFIASCEEIPYKTLARYPEDNKGKHIVLTVKISQIIQDGFFGNSVYYRVYTDNDGYGFYFDDEYLMYDSRTTDNRKLLDGDIIRVYGEFIGTESVMRALTGTKEDVPAFKAYYIDIFDEDEDVIGEYATLDKYNQIETGMTYEQVVEIMGTEGELMTTMDVMEITTAMYTWSGSDKLSSAIVTFEDNIVASKSQIGLE